MFDNFIYAKSESFRNIFWCARSSLDQVKNLCVLHGVKFLSQRGSKFGDNLCLSPNLSLMFSS